MEPSGSQNNKDSPPMLFPMVVDVPQTLSYLGTDIGKYLIVKI